jgi:hypothetical protein
LANLNESDYRQIGRAMRKLIEEYVERFNASTGKKLDKTEVNRGCGLPRCVREHSQKTCAIARIGE